MSQTDPVTMIHEEAVRLVAAHTDKHGELPEDAGYALESLLGSEDEDTAREILGDLRAALGLPSGETGVVEGDER